MSERDVLGRELAYHEKLYSGFAQSHFARPAVRALRAHMVQRILRVTGAGAGSRVLSLGCGIGDTELLLAPHVGEVVGVDLSSAGIRQARQDAVRLGIANARFEEGSSAAGVFDAVIAIFFLHHLSDDALAAFPAQLRGLLVPRGVFYSLDPSSRRISGAVGRKLIPRLMRRYQTEDERELEPALAAGLFRAAGFDARIEMYDFGSSPLAGLFPGWRRVTGPRERWTMAFCARRSAGWAATSKSSRARDFIRARQLRAAGTGLRQRLFGIRLAQFGDGIGHDGDSLPQPLEPAHRQNDANFRHHSINHEMIGARAFDRFPYFGRLEPIHRLLAGDGLPHQKRRGFVLPQCSGDAMRRPRRIPGRFRRARPRWKPPGCRGRRHKRSAARARG